MLTLVSLGLFACISSAAPPPGADVTPAVVPTPEKDQEVAVLAGGCFWCLEADMDKLMGVVSTTSGFAGGPEEHPTYEQVAHGDTGHTEAVYVVYDPQIVTYLQVLDWYWHHIDPTDAGGQFCDRGKQYRTAIFPQNDGQLAAAKASLQTVTDSAVLSGAVVTEIVGGQTFWPAEKYHQDYSQTNAMHYQRYRTGCGRDDKVAKVWAKMLRQPQPLPH
ncbi:MAG: peptide-methionine (S)-S-oxide reductase MsrA [Myxococcales bacterium]|nr:peptide-methionine (S)-S-oxide reductase MsrA [Myxococcales bacterium]